MYFNYILNGVKIRINSYDIIRIIRKKKIYSIEGYLDGNYDKEINITIFLDSQGNFYFKYNNEIKEITDFEYLSIEEINELIKNNYDIPNDLIFSSIYKFISEIEFIIPTKINNFKLGKINIRIHNKKTQQKNILYKIDTSIPYDGVNFHLIPTNKDDLLTVRKKKITINDLIDLLLSKKIIICRKNESNKTDSHKIDNIKRRVKSVRYR